MSRAAKSHVPYTSGVKHPFTAMAETFANNHPALTAMRDFVRASVIKTTPSLYNHADVKAAMANNGMLDNLRDIIRQAIKVEPSENGEKLPMPKPPPATEIYGRLLAGTEVLDVGSGDAKRLIQFAGQFKVRTMDKEVEATKIDAPHECSEFTEPTDEVVTSFMALSNNKDTAAFEESDGIHLVPNMSELALAGISEKEGDHYVTITPEKTYVDYDVNIPKTEITPFFDGVNTFKPRHISVFTSHKTITKMPPLPSLGTRCTSLPPKGSPLSLKYEGILFRYRRKGGKSVIVSRDGEVCASSETGDVVDMDLWLEQTANGPRLLRVNLFRGFRPFHSLAALEHFCDRVAVEIDGHRVRPPERFTSEEQLTRGDVEGLVFRECGEDFLIRNRPAIDVSVGDIPALLEELLDAGLTVTHVDPAPVSELAVAEYEVVVERSECSLKLRAMRNKKPDHPRKIREFLSWPTVRDFLAEHQEKVPGMSKEYLDNEPDSDSE